MWNDMSIPQWNWQKYLVFSRKSIKEKGMKEINRGLSHKYHYDVPNCFWPKVLQHRQCCCARLKIQMESQFSYGPFPDW